MDGNNTLADALMVIGILACVCWVLIEGVKGLGRLLMRPKPPLAPEEPPVVDEFYDPKTSKWFRRKFDEDGQCVGWKMGQGPAAPPRIQN